MSGIKDPPLVPGRECGGCSECCVAMTIDVPDLWKLSGVRCHNLLPTHRRVARVDNKLRPAVRARDKEGVLHWLRTAWDGGRMAPSEEVRRSGPPTAPTNLD